MKKTYNAPCMEVVIIKSDILLLNTSNSEYNPEDYTILSKEEEDDYKFGW